MACDKLTVVKGSSWMSCSLAFSAAAPPQQRGSKIKSVSRAMAELARIEKGRFPSAWFSVRTDEPSVDIAWVRQAWLDGGACVVCRNVRTEVEGIIGRDASDDEKMAFLLAFAMDDARSVHLFTSSQTMETGRGSLPPVDVHLDFAGEREGTDVVAGIASICEREWGAEHVYTHGTFRYAANKIIHGVTFASLGRAYDFGDGLYLHCPSGDAVRLAVEHAANRGYRFPVVMAFKVREGELRAHGFDDLAVKATWQRVVRSFLSEEPDNEHLCAYRFVRGAICSNLREVQREPSVVPVQMRALQLLIRQRGADVFFGCCERIKVFVLPSPPRPTRKRGRT